IPMVENVEECTHLLVPQLDVTRKLVHGLVSGCWLGALDYIQQIKVHPYTHTVSDPTVAHISEYIQNLEYMPVPQRPELPANSPIDLSNVSWLPDRRRQHLFDAKMFVFVDKTQYDKYLPVIKKSGGSCVMLPNVEEWVQSPNHSTSELEAQSKLSADSLQILIKGNQTLHLVLPPTQQGGSDTTELDSTVLVKYTARNLRIRPISVSEVSLAVLFVSCDDHTNTDLRNTPDAENLPETNPPGTVDISNVLKPHRRRKAARVSGFWASAVSGETPEKSVKDQFAEPKDTVLAESVVSSDPDLTINDTPTSSKATTRHRRKVNEFWSSAACTDPPQTTTVDEPTVTVSSPTPIIPTENPEPDSAPTGLNDGKAEITTTGEGSKLVTKAVSLIKHKASLASSASTTSSGKPNFKRFKKTMHPYQIA
ncbi:hypothetical protein H4S00_003260, partial [Coemansia sp. D1744]